jgi:hypothetical protein
MGIPLNAFNSVFSPEGSRRYRDDKNCTCAMVQSSVCAFLDTAATWLCTVSSSLSVESASILAPSAVNFDCAASPDAVAESASAVCAFASALSALSPRDPMTKPDSSLVRTSALSETIRARMRTTVDHLSKRLLRLSPSHFSPTSATSSPKQPRTTNASAMYSVHSQRVSEVDTDEDVNDTTNKPSSVRRQYKDRFCPAAFISDRPRHCAGFASAAAFSRSAAASVVRPCRASAVASPVCASA